MPDHTTAVTLAAHPVVVQKVSQFWPTVTRISAALAAVGGFVSAVVSLKGNRKVDDVHVLVNGNFSKTASGLEEAVRELKNVAAERDKLRMDLDRLGARRGDHRPPTV